VSYEQLNERANIWLADFDNVLARTVSGLPESLHSPNSTPIFSLTGDDDPIK